ncbi:MAG: hypothetical protein J0M04_21175 [Verrucomicrobia bacterium]|nr:hypothetical protein [Verrucomicrobiota bacterium]
MKTIAGIFFLCALVAKASLLAIVTVKQPLHLANSGGGDEILIRDVQVVSDRAGLEVELGAIVLPFTPLTDGSWKHPADVNIASLAGIKIRANDPGKGEIDIVVDAAVAKVPANVSFTIEEVVDATVRCVQEVASAHGRKVKISVEKPANPKGEPQR